MTRLRVFGLAAALLFGLAALHTTPAVAQGSGQDDRPWAKGVSQEDQKAALAIFSEGNSMLRDSLFVKAVEKYAKALEHWSHPAIHYNLALALLNLDKPLQVHATLEKTLKFGAAPIGDDKFEHAQSYLTLVKKQLATLTVTCDVKGAKVTLDGHDLFVGPGKHEGLVRAGEHTVIAEKKGYVTTTLTRMLGPGATVKIPVKMFTDAELTRYRRKWTPWKPWAVAGGGGALLLVGGTVHMLARSKYNTYDDRIAACGGCVPSSQLESKKDNAGLLQAMAFTGYLLGAGAAATGAVLLYMNRAKPYRIDPSKLNDKITVTPIIAPDTAGIAAAFRF